jgi:hypothetical protein
MKKLEDGFDRFVTYAALFAALYIYWPKDFSNTPLAGLTLKHRLRYRCRVLPDQKSLRTKRRR